MSWQNRDVAGRAPAVVVAARRRRSPLMPPSDANPEINQHHHYLPLPVPVDAVTASDAMRDLSRAINSLMEKPEAYIMVCVQGSASMCFAQSEEPCAFAELFSVGAIGGDKNVAIAREVMALVTGKLGVPKERCYMNFVDAARADFGWNGTTFGAM